MQASRNPDIPTSSGRYTVQPLPGMSAAPTSGCPKIIFSRLPKRMSKPSTNSAPIPFRSVGPLLIENRISDFGYSGYCEYFIGQLGSTHMHKNDSEKDEYSIISNPYLTFLYIHQLR
jgi:hypothetical protein